MSDAKKTPVDPRPGAVKPHPDRVEKSEEEWRAQLTDEQYRVTREAGTERPFTGAYWDSREPGTYTCICCGQVLFRSDDKFDSGCGWPSFTRPFDEGTVTYHDDGSLAMKRTEVRCAKCDAHLGHVFEDGPQDDTGLRFCINSVCLEHESGASS